MCEMLHIVLRWAIPYLCAGYVHSSGVQPLFHLVRVVNLQHVIPAKLQVVQRPSHSV